MSCGFALHGCLKKLFFCSIVCVYGIYACDNQKSPSKQKDTITIESSYDSETIHRLVSDIPQGYHIRTLDYSSDITFSVQEFWYAMDIRCNQECTEQAVARSCFYLLQKKKFETISIEYVCDEAEHIIDIHFILKAAWTFAKLQLQGLLYGIDKYQQYYLIEPGECFDYHKHQHSLEKLQEALYCEGFLQAKIYDYLHYDHTIKSVCVGLTIERGTCYTIDTISVDVRCSDTTLPLSYSKKVAVQITKWLKGAQCTEGRIQDQVKYLKKYFAKKGFMYADIEVRKVVQHDLYTVDLHFVITVQQRKKIIFLGNTFFSQQNLFDDVCAFGHIGLFLPESLIKEEIFQKYYAKGFWNVDIDVKQEVNRSFFIIRQGPRAEVIDIILEGVQKKYEKSVYAFFKSCLKARFIDAELLKQALYDVGIWYQTEGYWDVQIIKHTFRATDKPHKHVLVVTLDEGIRRFVRSLCIPQFPELLHEGPFKKFDTQTPLICTTTMLQEQRQWLLQYFQQQGYMQVQVKHEIAQEGSAVDVTWNITDTQQQIQFGKIIVIGAPHFPFQHIQRELVFRQGDIWSKAALQESLMRLRKLGIFESISLYPIELSDCPFEKPVIIKLKEADPFEIRLRAGFQQVSKNLPFHRGSTYKLGGTVRYKNPFWQGDCIKLDTDVTRYYRNMELVYQRPWLFGEPITTIIKGYNNKYIQPVFIGSNKPLYQAVQQGILFGMSRTWCHYAVGCNSGLEWMETDHISVELARAINFKPTLINRKIPFIYAEPSIIIDFLDNQVNPTYGLLTVISCKVMLPTNDRTAHFFKILAEQSVFMPLLWSLVFALRVRFGHIFNQDFNTIMPPERFYLGGQNSIRSYEANQAPPLGSFVQENGKREFVPQGGRSMVNVNIELRIPLMGHFGAILFQDIGTLVENSFAEIKGGGLLAGTGFGLRYYSPAGPIRFDIGWKWKKADPNEASHAWFLMLGHAF